MSLFACREQEGHVVPEEAQSESVACTDASLVPGDDEVVVANTIVKMAQAGVHPDLPGRYLDTSLDSGSQNVRRFQESVVADLRAELATHARRHADAPELPPEDAEFGRIWVPLHSAEVGMIAYHGCNDAPSLVAEVGDGLVRCASISSMGAMFCQSLQVDARSETPDKITYTLTGAQEVVVSRQASGWTLTQPAPLGDEIIESPVIALQDAHRIPLLFTVCDGPIHSMVRELSDHQRCQVP